MFCVNERQNTEGTFCLDAFIKKRLKGAADIDIAKNLRASDELASSNVTTPDVDACRIASWLELSDTMAAERRTRGKRVDCASPLKPAALPRGKSVPKRMPMARSQHELYDLDVVERDSGSGRVKVHSIGYSSGDDEWRDESDIVVREICDILHIHSPFRYVENLPK